MSPASSVDAGGGKAGAGAAEGPPALSHREMTYVHPGAKGVCGVKLSTAFWELLSPTLVLKSSPTHLETE